ncbi:MAG: hypothetical protein ACRDJP_03525, partial [Actinomycetota bacterium]
RELLVPEGTEHVAAGACVQAAAVLHQRPPEDVAAAWGLGRATPIEPDLAVDTVAVRSAFAAATPR